MGFRCLKADANKMQRFYHISYKMNHLANEREVERLILIKLWLLLSVSMILEKNEYLVTAKKIKEQNILSVFENREKLKKGDISHGPKDLYYFHYFWNMFIYTTLKEIMMSSFLDIRNTVTWVFFYSYHNEKLWQKPEI